MKFIIDENISPELVTVFHNAGLNAWHINELKTHQKQRIIDDQLRRLSIQKGCIIVTKDDDFVHSFVDRKVPEKLIYLYGLNKKESLLLRLNEIVNRLPDLVLDHDFIEINPSEIRFPFSY